MVQMVISFIVVLHVLFRGDSTVTSNETGRVKLQRRCCILPSGKERCIVLRCRQFRHTVVYSRWYMMNRRYHTYAVEMVNVDDDVFSDYHVGHYPQLCLSVMNATDFPLSCAINAHLDLILSHCVQV